MRSHACPPQPAAPRVIIAAAGASSRMGRPKLLLPVGRHLGYRPSSSQWRTLGAAQIECCVPVRKMIGNSTRSWYRLGFPPGGPHCQPRPERGMFSSIQCAAGWEGWGPCLTVWRGAGRPRPHLRMETLRPLLVSSGTSVKICHPLTKAGRTPGFAARVGGGGIRAPAAAR